MGQWSEAAARNRTNDDSQNLLPSNAMRDQTMLTIESLQSWAAACRAIGIETITLDTLCDKLDEMAESRLKTLVHEASTYKP